MLSRSQLIFRYEPEALTVFANMAAMPSDTRRRVIDRLIRDLKVAGVWPKLDCLYLFAAHDSTAALINWKNPGTFNATLVNSPTFAVDRGFTGNGTTSYMDTNFVPSTAGGVFVQDSAHVSGRSLTDQAASAGTTNRLFGNTAATTPRSTLATRSVGDLLTGRITCAADAFQLIASANSSGHFIANRSGSGALQVYRSGASIGTSTTASTGLPTTSIGFSRDATGVAFGTMQIAGGSIGASLSAAEAAAFHAAEQAYLQSVGAV